MSVLLESLYDHAKAGNAAARSIFRRAGRYLAVGLANVVNLFDPELIILSGERMRYDYLYAAEMLAEMEALMLTTGRPAPEDRDPRLGRPALGPRRGGAGAVGGDRGAAGAGARGGRAMRCLVAPLPPRRPGTGAAGRRRARRSAFIDRAAALPAQQVYSGGWEHFVGGGVAVIDCNADGYPDLFAAGGVQPGAAVRQHHRHARRADHLPAGRTARHSPTSPAPIRWTSTATACLDLFVMRVGPNVVLKGGPRLSFHRCHQRLAPAAGRRLDHRLLRDLGGGRELADAGRRQLRRPRQPQRAVRGLRREPADPSEGRPFRPADPPQARVLRAVDADHRLEADRGARPADLERPALLRARRLRADVAPRAHCANTGRRTAGSRSRSGAWGSPAATSTATACPT